jgi:hypothetical protein
LRAVHLLRGEEIEHVQHNVLAAEEEGFAYRIRYSRRRVKERLILRALWQLIVTVKYLETTAHAFHTKVRLSWHRVEKVAVIV